MYMSIQYMLVCVCGQMLCGLNVILGSFGVTHIGCRWAEYAMYHVHSRTKLSDRWCCSSQRRTLSTSLSTYGWPSTSRLINIKQRNTITILPGPFDRIHTHTALKVVSASVTRGLGSTPRKCNNANIVKAIYDEQTPVATKW